MAPGRRYVVGMSQLVKNQLKTVVLLGALSVLLIGLGAWISPGYLWFFVGLAVLMNVGSYFFSDKIVLAMNRAHPVDPREAPGLHRMVEDLAREARIPKPRVYIVNDPAPNAFATGRNPKNGVVAVTTGILDILTERELRGVLAHELAHIRNRDILVASIAAMIATVITSIASLLQWSTLLGGMGGRDQDRGAGNVFGALALAILAPIAATVIQLAISRSREYLADASGARLGGDPMGLASALAKLDAGNRRIPVQSLSRSPATASLFICAPLSGQGLVKWFSTHPPIPERIERLRQMAAGTASRAAA